MSRVKAIPYAVAWAGIILGLAFWIHIARLTPHANDDGYFQYLISMYAHEGLVPIRDMLSEYSPGYIFIFTWARSLFGDSPTGLHLFVMVVGIASIGMTFLVARKHNIPYLGCMALVIVTESMWLVYEGEYAYLEPLVMMFTLGGYLALLYAVPGASLVAGILLGMALMTKQTAILFVPAFLIQVMHLVPERKTKHLLVFLLGLCIPFGMFCAAYSMEPFSTAWYLADYGHRVYREDAMPFMFLFKFHTEMWVFSVPILVSVVWVALKHRREYSFELACFCGGVLICSFQPWYHYFLTIVPWGCLFVMRTGMDVIQGMKVKARVVGVILIAVIGIYMGRERISEKVSSLAHGGSFFRSFYGGMSSLSRDCQYQRGAIIKGWVGAGRAQIFGDAVQQYVSGIRLFMDEPNMGWLRYPRDWDIIQSNFVGKTDLIVVVRSGDRYGYALLIDRLVQNGYSIRDRQVVNSDHLHFLTCKSLESSRRP